jgi:hypothetical protein
MIVLSSTTELATDEHGLDALAERVFGALIGRAVPGQAAGGLGALSAASKLANMRE